MLNSNSSDETAVDSSTQPIVNSSADIEANPMLAAVFIHEMLNELIPYVSENVITYPLWEEGKYIPFLNFWQKADTNNAVKELNKRLRKLEKKTGYKIAVEEKEYRSVIHRISIYPDFNDTDDGDYEFVKKDWSIEEMILIVGGVLK